MRSLCISGFVLLLGACAESKAYCSPKPLAEKLSASFGEAKQAANEAAPACLPNAWAQVSTTFEPILQNMEELDRNETLRLDSTEARERRCAHVTRIADLDGDGQEDFDLSAGCQWNKTWPHAIVLSRGCRFAGVLWGADVLRYMPRGRRPPDVVTHSANSCAGADFTETRYRWRRGSYRTLREIHCNFCEDGNGRAHRRCNRELLQVDW